jgi:hypothetical protein
MPEYEPWQVFYNILFQCPVYSVDLPSLLEEKADASLPKGLEISPVERNTTLEFLLAK